jgi:hypothetical protein
LPERLAVSSNGRLADSFGIRDTPVTQSTD